MCNEEYPITLHSIDVRFRVRDKKWTARLVSAPAQERTKTYALPDHRYGAGFGFLKTISKAMLRASLIAKTVDGAYQIMADKLMSIVGQYAARVRAVERAAPHDTTPYQGFCPNCGGDQFDGEGVEIEGNWARQPVSCLACGEEWDQFYVAAHREITRLGRRKEQANERS